MKRLLLVFLFIVFVVDLCIIGLQLGSSLRYFTKPLLVPILIIYYSFNVQKLNWLFVAGLIMCFFGDLFLMFSWGFIAGLSSFLIAHILYNLTFKRLFHRKNLLSIPVIILFIVCLCAFLFPHLGAMKIPVFLYALTIGLMQYTALGTNLKWLIIGALLFVLSDSILSINLFYQKSIIGSLCVMLTYVIAQFCLVRGMIKSSFRME